MKRDGRRSKLPVISGSPETGEPMGFSTIPSVIQRSEGLAESPLRRPGRPDAQERNIYNTVK